MSVTELQKDPDNLKILYAFRFQYSLAKRCRLPRIIITYVLAIGLPTLLFLLPECIQETWKPKFAVIGAAWAFISYYLVNYEKKCTKMGAEIQDHFDSKVFGLHGFGTMINERPSYWMINALNRRYDGKPDECWHGDLSGIPSPYDALVAQSNTLEWDWRLRSRYLMLVIGILITLAVAQIVFAKIFNLSIDDALLTFLLPSLSAYILGMKECREHHENIEGRKAVQKKIIQYIDESLKSGETPDKMKIRQFQDVIYMLRKGPAVVPGIANKWMNKGLRDDNANTIEDYRKAIRQRIK